MGVLVLPAETWRGRHRGAGVHTPGVSQAAAVGDCSVRCWGDCHSALSRLQEGASPGEFMVVRRFCVWAATRRSTDVGDAVSGGKIWAWRFGRGRGGPPRSRGGLPSAVSGTSTVYFLASPG